MERKIIMARKKTLGKTTTLRFAAPDALCRRVLAAAQDNRRSVSEFLRIFLDDNLPKGKGVSEHGKSN